MHLKLPYFAPSEQAETVLARRNVAANLDAIAEWIREEARELELDQQERTAGTAGLGEDLREGADVIALFAGGVRP